MVMQEGESQEVVGQDILDLDQQVLDQGMTEEVAEPQFVTREQFDQMMTNHQQVINENQSMKNHLSGLESRIDKQANAYRMEMQNQAEAAARKQAVDLQNRILENFDDPDQRVLWQQYFEAQTNIAAPVQQVVEQPVQQQVESQQTDKWAEVQQFVVNYGVDPTDSRIDYSVLIDQTITDSDRQKKFLANLKSVLRETITSPIAEQPGLPVQQQSANSTPQRSVGPAGTGYRNSEDLMDAFITGKVDATKYRELAPKFGIPL